MVFFYIIYNETEHNSVRCTCLISYWDLCMFISSASRSSWMVRSENPWEQQAYVEDGITNAEIQKSSKTMKKGKATGHDNLRAEVWKSLWRTGVNYLKEAPHKFTDEKVTDKWRKSILIPSTRIRDTSRIVQTTGQQAHVSQKEVVRERNSVSISEQFGFMKGKSTPYIH